jgi:23S rRNA (guanine745-N1)-methyltransferase
MNDAVLAHLRCPNCESALVTLGARGPLRCARGHSFDIAKQGYATLTAGRTPHTGDSTEMIADRERFLAAGHYAFIAEALATAAAQVAPRLANARVVAPGRADAQGVAPGSAARLVVDAGTGTGYYLARVLDELPAAVGLGLDVSKPALRRAARAHQRADAALADLWQPLPLADGSAALILDVFAPRNGAEFHRVLHPGGALLVVTPAADHLAELIDAFGLIRVDPDKADRVSGSLGTHFTATATTTHRHRMRLNDDEVRTLIGMTPSARHVHPNPARTGPHDADAGIAGAGGTGTGAGDAGPTAAMDVTAAIDLTIYRRA